MSDDLERTTGTPAHRDSARVRKRGTRERGRIVLAAALTAIVTIFAVLNLDQVAVDLVIFGTEQIPLIVVIAASALLGLAIGYIAGRRSS
jgi:uncharacterized integral membrane protein